MAKGLGAAISAGFRSVVAILAIASVGLCGWSLHIIDDAEIRGSTILEMSRLDEEMERKWQEFLLFVVDSNARIWVTLGAGVFVIFTATFSLLSVKVGRLAVSLNVLLALDLGATIATTIALASSLWVFLILAPFCKTIESSPPPALAATALLCPVTRGSLVGNGVGWILMTTTSMITLITVCRRAREKKSCSFEPTVSALGMGRGYQAVAPAFPRTTIPTMYDPAKPIPETAPRTFNGAKEASVVAAKASGKRDSVMSGASMPGDGEISGPLSLEKPEVVKQMRPPRPWSEAPRQK